MRPSGLSARLPIVATVGRDPAVRLIGRGPIPLRPRRGPTPRGGCPPRGTPGITRGFPRLFPGGGQVAHVLLARSPLYTRPRAPYPLDLHVLGAPPAFVLSQDRTLRPGGFASSAGAPGPLKSELFWIQGIGGGRRAPPCMKSLSSDLLRLSAVSGSRGPPAPPRGGAAMYSTAAGRGWQAGRGMSMG